MKLAAVWPLVATPALLMAQGGGRGGASQAPQNPRAAAPVDLTGYWVSQIVDEWRFRAAPQKGDIPYLPLNPEARKMANAWDPAADEAAGNACKAYGAIGVMQRPGRLHFTWETDTVLRIEADAGTQTRLLRFGPPPAQKSDPSWQGYSQAQWEFSGAALGGRRGAAAAGGPRSGQLKVVTTNMKPGYLRKNGVPYSDRAVLTEYFNLLTGAQKEQYLNVTALVEDPVYLTGPFIRSYQFKKQPDGSGWDPTGCMAR
jgi:hypothetical protein